MPAPQEEVADERVEIDVRFDADRRVPNRVLRRKRMLAWSVNFATGVESRVQVGPFRIERLPILVLQVVGQRKIVEPGAAEERTRHQLELAIGKIRGAAILAV